jgi:hypothetical protein
LATINVMQDRAPGVQYVILVLVAVPKSHEDGSVSQETHMGINFWPPTARPEDLRTCLLVSPLTLFVTTESFQNHE